MRFEARSRPQPRQNHSKKSFVFQINAICLARHYPSKNLRRRFRRPVIFGVDPRI